MPTATLMPYAFKEAVVDNDADKVEQLLREGMDPNVIDEQGYDALNIASINGYTRIARLLIDNGAEINKEAGEFTPLMAVAMGGGDVETAQILINNGAKIEATTSHGWTALMYGVNEYRNTAVVRLLLDKKADMHVRNKDGDTALDIAEKFNTPEMAQLLQEASKDQDYHATALERQKRLKQLAAKSFVIRRAP